MGEALQDGLGVAADIVDPVFVAGDLGERVLRVRSERLEAGSRTPGGACLKLTPPTRGWRSGGVCRRTKPGLRTASESEPPSRSPRPGAVPRPPRTVR